MSDKMVDIEVDFTEEEFLKIAIMAHEEDITFNQYIKNVLQAAVDAEEKQNG